MKTALALLVGCLLLSFGPAASQSLPKFVVPDAETAVKIGEAVLIPVYGKKIVEAEEPFSAKLTAGVWVVSGTLRCPDGHGGMTTNCVGGVAVVRISKKDGRVLSIVHYK